MTRKKKIIPKVPTLDNANVTAAVIDTQMSGDPFNAADQPFNMIIDPNIVVEPQVFDFGVSPVEGYPSTLLDEVVKVVEQVKKKKESAIERSEDIEEVNTERDQKLRILAQTHLPSRYYDAKHDVLIAAQSGARTVVVATFKYPLDAYDEILFSGLKRMFTADAMTVIEQVSQDLSQDLIEMKVMW